MADDSSREKSQQKVVVNRMVRVCRSSGSVPKSPKSAADLNLSRHKIEGKIQKRSSKSASALRPTKSATKCTSSQKKSQSKLTLKDQQMNRLVFQEGGLPDGSELTYICHGKMLLEGHKIGRGIYCYCCNTKVSPSQFEAHAGQASRKKPYGNIFVSNGVSLHQYASSLKLNCERLAKNNDARCRSCGDGGDLLLCDGCPRSFHQECVSETSIPLGKWFCKYCRNSMKCVGQNANAVAAGRVSGVDPIEQIAKRCIRIIQNPEKCDLVACVLCRCYDFSKSGFNDRTVIVCDQCEKEYHIGCLREHNKADLKDLPKGEWFCNMDCGRIYSFLKNLVTCGPEKVPDSLMALIRKKWKDSDADSITNFDMKWILLRGKDASHESRLLLTETVDIFHDCFDPIIDSITGSDFIPSMAYGKKMGDSDFAGMHCAMLTIDTKVVTAGLFRVLGQDIAELPVVATNKSNQGKGYFQLFFTCFERLLSYLSIKKIVLPAAEDAKSLWTNKLGFCKVTPKQLSEYRQSLTSMVAFQGTTVLEKKVRQGEITFADGVDFSLSME